MKKSHIGIVSIVLTYCTLLFTSCIDEDYKENCNKRYLVARTTDVEPDTIKNNVAFYIFDENKKFESVITTGLDKEVEFDKPSANKYTVVCFGYAPEARMPVLQKGTYLTDARIMLDVSIIGNDTLATSPYELFYGMIDITQESDPVNTCWIKRKISALTIITHHLQSALSTTDTDFTYLVRRTYRTLNFDGTFEGEKVMYKPAVRFNTNNKDFIAQMFYTFPSFEEEGISIDIYKANKRIATYNPTLDGNPVLLQEGKQTTIWIDFNNEGNDGQMNVTCKVEDWKKVNINEYFD